MSGDVSPRRPDLVVGLTGGLASGKSTVASMFEALGVPVLDADALAREAVEPGEPALTEIVDAFGSGILDAGGRLDRARLREAVFRDPQRRRRLESIVHPRVRAAMRTRLAALEGPYAVLVVPLLFEAGQDDLVDRVLVVDVPEPVQVERAARRDGVSPESARRVLDAQIGRAARLERADDVIDNSAPATALAATVDDLHARYLAIARAVAARRG